MRSGEDHGREQLPVEMQNHIFSFLTNRDLVNAMQVNHAWYAIIKSHQLDLRARKYLVTILKTHQIDFEKEYETDVLTLSDQLVNIANEFYLSFRKNAFTKQVKTVTQEAGLHKFGHIQPYLLSLFILAYPFLLGFLISGLPKNADEKPYIATDSPAMMICLIELLFFVPFCLYKTANHLYRSFNRYKNNLPIEAKNISTDIIQMAKIKHEKQPSLLASSGLFANTSDEEEVNGNSHRVRIT